MGVAWLKNIYCLHLEILFEFDCLFSERNSENNLRLMTLSIQVARRKEGYIPGNMAFMTFSLVLREIIRIEVKFVKPDGKDQQVTSTWKLGNSLESSSLLKTK